MTGTPGRAVSDARFFEDGATFELAEPLGLLECRCHPDSDEITADYVRWVRTELARHATPEQVHAILAARYELWTCLGFAQAMPERAGLIARWTTLYFILDDIVTNGDDDGGADAARPQVVLDVLAAMLSGDGGALLPRDGGVPAALLALIGDVFARLRANMGAPQWQRLVRELIAWGELCVREMDARTSRVELSFEDVVALREVSSCSVPCSIYVEYSLGIDLGESRPPMLRRIERAYARHATIVNDLHSFRLEHYNDDHVNAVAAGCLVDGLSLQESVDRVSELISHTERAFVDQRDELFAAELGQRWEVRRYVTGLEHLMAGNLRWSYVTGRYHGKDHAWNGKTGGTVTLLPDRTLLCTAAPPSPACIVGDAVDR